jgi:serine/threonine-protein kinase RsbW
MVALVCKLALEERGSAAGGEALKNELMSAVGEAFNNIVLHGYAEHASGDVRLLAEFDSERIVVEILDHGASFDPALIATPDLAVLPESGLGYYIIRSFVDHVDYRPGPPNVLRLTKSLLVT